MKVNPYISKTEKTLSIFISSFIFSFVIVNLCSILFEDYLFRSKGIDFSICGIPRVNLMPHFRFFAILALPLSLLDKKFMFFVINNLLSFISFSFEIYYVLRHFYENESQLKFIEILSYSIRPLDFIVFVAISVILIWQISIFYRIQKTKLI